jgi:hypothetical protein
MIDSRLGIEDVINSLKFGRRDRYDYEILIFLQNNYLQLLNDMPELTMFHLQALLITNRQGDRKSNR